MDPTYIWVAKEVKGKIVEKRFRSKQLHNSLAKILIHIIFFLYCSKGRQCIPDVNGKYFQHRDPKKYGEYCRNMRSNCHGPVCKYTSEDTNDDVNPQGK